MIPRIPWWRALFTRQGRLQKRYYRLSAQLEFENPGSGQWLAIFKEMDILREKINGEWL